MTTFLLKTPQRSKLTRLNKLYKRAYMETGTPQTSFADLGLNAGICKTLTQLGYEVPTPVQLGSIPILLEGNDLIGQAGTGTGKTAAFALPLINRMKPGVSGTQVLVLTPTRELAIQVAEAFQSYARGHKNFHIVPIYGGQSMFTQCRQLERGPHVVVGTPGRIMDHLRRKTLTLDSITSLVIDEADEMLSMGFIEDIEWIIEQAPKEKQTALFSATMPRAIRTIAQKYLQNPKEVKIEQTTSKADLIDQSYWVVAGPQKLDALTRILEVSEMDGLLIFVRTKVATVEVAEKLEARGYSCGTLNGDMTQEARERTVDKFKKSKLDVLVATDVAARGLDIDRISHVVNFDAPFDPETYTHRIGRTGRAGRSGSAILFISPREYGLLRSIERSTKSKISAFKMPTVNDVAARRIDRLVEKVAATLDHPELSQYESVIKTLEERAHSSPGRIAATLCALLHDDSPLFIQGPDLLHQQSLERPRENKNRSRSSSRRNNFRGGRDSHREDRGQERSRDRTKRSHKPYADSQRKSHTPRSVL